VSPIVRGAGWVVILVVAIACAGPVGVRGPADGSHWIDDGDLFSAGFGTVSFVARDGHALKARVYRSTGFDPPSGPIWFVMHGTDRDADRYVEVAAPVAERHGALAVVIHFDDEAYPRAEDYTLGVYEADTVRSDGQAKRWRHPGDMLYAEVERVFDLVRSSLGGAQTGYYIFGHSAGAQFAHRLLTFLPEHRALVAVAANAGWYTLPVADDPRVHTMPYGLVDAPVDPAEMRGLLETPLVVLLSEFDTTTSANDDLVRGTPAAEAQGKNRLERGHHYFATGQTAAASLGADFAWRREIVSGAGHDVAEVIASAGFLTFGSSQSATAACDGSSSAAATGAIAITEVLADPPDGPAGDTNGDAVRDPDDDEFIEIVNAGASPVCLAGWSLGDATASDRFVFPLGAGLRPGEIVVVFGGGVPTGGFRGARVERAPHGLSLQNAGDVLTLRDVTGSIVEQASWGDCAESACARDHWSGSLGVEGSMSRTPGRGRWWIPEEDADLRFSPGVLR
jgi:hypothetical protein